MTGSDGEPGKLSDSQLDVLSPDTGSPAPPPNGGPADGGPPDRGPAADGPGLAAWRDPGRSGPERVADLLRRMTLAEKVAQLRSTWPGRTPDGPAETAGGGD